MDNTIIGCLQIMIYKQGKRVKDGVQRHASGFEFHKRHVSVSYKKKKKKTRRKERIVNTNHKEYYIFLFF